MRATSFRTAAFSLLAFAISGCEAATDADSLNDNTPLPGGSGGGGAGSIAGSGPVAEGGSTQVGSAGSPPVTTGGSAPSMAGAASFGGSNVGVGGASGGSPSTTTAGSGPVGTAGSGVVPMGGSAGTDAMGGMPGTAGMVGTAGAAPMGGSGGTPPAMGPYDPRTGSFKMLAYSLAKGYVHPSIPAGQEMLRQIAKEQGFEIEVTNNNSEFTPENLAKYEIVFFNNTTGEIFGAAEEKAFEEWMTTKNGAFAGVHAATDTEERWAFYKEVTGQYYNGHDQCCEAGQIQWDSAATDFIAVKGLPSPWQRNEEWYRFNSSQSWTTKMGFRVLSRVNRGGTLQPVSYIREWGNFRSFYTSLGHEEVAFRDANVKKHIAAGIMWAVRREALLK